MDHKIALDATTTASLRRHDPKVAAPISSVVTKSFERRDEKHAFCHVLPSPTWSRVICTSGLLLIYHSIFSPSTQQPLVLSEKV
jgi:hypothetical protein